MSYITIHDQPGEHKFNAYFPGIAAKQQGVALAFVTPFKCVISNVDYRPGSVAWLLADGTNYCNLVLLNKGVNGTASVVSLGTIVGSPTADIVPIGSAKTLYAGGTTQYPANTVFVGSVGTIGAGSVAVPAGFIEVTFKAC